VDDARSAASVDPFVATIGLVAIAGFVRALGACLRVSAGRHPFRRTSGLRDRPRYLDPALHRPSLIGQRQADVLCCVTAASER
jgi:hypothetical protein